MAHLAQSFIDYLKGAREELKKVTWPTKKQTKNHTLVVIGLSVAIAVFFSVLDLIFNYGVEFITQFKKF
jgi:preprotein translocase subunit SecE